MADPKAEKIEIQTEQTKAKTQDVNKQEGELSPTEMDNVAGGWGLVVGT
jgi:hypothetical protein